MKKVVITGGPCSGKTTVINELGKRGYEVVGEVARNVINERKNNPLTYDEHHLRQELIFLRQVEKEKQVHADVTFFDRGIFDNFAYQLHFLGDVIPKYLELVKNYPRYNGVFVLERLPFEHDGLRIEEGELEAQKLHDDIVMQYDYFGYKPIFVPVMDIEKRVDFVIRSVLEEKND